MGNDTTNQKKGIVTRGSGHIAESSGTTLPYYRVLYIGTVMDVNHIETAKCAPAQAAQRTFIAGHQVLHHRSKIGIPHGGGPSRYDAWHGVAQNTPPSYEYFAEPVSKSPDTKVEGKWIVRTYDVTWQDGHNGVGKFNPAPGSAELLDESELLFQQCAVEKMKLESVYKADNGTSTNRFTMAGELHVYIGQEVTVTAYRINATETDPGKKVQVHCDFAHYKQKKNPPAEETKHAAFVLTRNGRNLLAGIMGSSWSEIKNKVLVGKDGSADGFQTSIIELKKDWLLESNDKPSNAAVGPVGGTYESYDRRQDGNSVQFQHANAARDRERLEGQAKDTKEEAQRIRKDLKKSGAPKKATTPELEAADAQRKQASKDLKQFNRNEHADAATRAKNADASALIASTARLALDSWAIIQEVWLYKPLKIDITAHGCSPGANAVIKAFPSEQYGAELASLKDFPGRKPLETLNYLITTIKDFFQKIKGTKVREIGKTFGADPGLGAKTGFNIDVYFFRH
ncbi:MAG TPA: hypothetical protein PK156_20340, partial [Polyangium sp.]|nr:hypothetical protein [Polyangium sp.]